MVNKIYSDNFRKHYSYIFIWILLPIRKNPQACFTTVSSKAIQGSHSDLHIISGLHSNLHYLTNNIEFLYYLLLKVKPKCNNLLKKLITLFFSNAAHSHGTQNWTQAIKSPTNRPLGRRNPWLEMIPQFRDLSHMTCSHNICSRKLKTSSIRHSKVLKKWLDFKMMWGKRKDLKAISHLWWLKE